MLILSDLVTFDMAWNTMTAILELVLMLAGGLLLTSVILLILIPLFYGVPFVFYWTLRGYLKWRTPFLYSSGLIFPILAASGLVAVPMCFLPNFVVYLITNFWFMSGLLVGIILSLSKIVFFKSARADIHYHLIDTIKPYVTPKGKLVLLALLARW